jgi:predicted RNA binding protein YcfA (HicA-like mRNA interferase family)
MTKRERDLRRLARRHGWALTKTTGGHWLLKHPDGHRVVASFSPGDVGNLKVVAGCMRRALRPERDGAARGG